MKEEEGGKEAKALGFQRLPGFSKIKRWLEFSDNFGKTINSVSRALPFTEIFRKSRQAVYSVCMSKKEVCGAEGRCS